MSGKGVLATVVLLCLLFAGPVPVAADEHLEPEDPVPTGTAIPTPSPLDVTPTPGDEGGPARVGTSSTVTAPTVTLSVRPRVFSPNGDGRLERTTITARVDQDAELEIEVLGPQGGVRRRWTRAVAAGEAVAVEWNGRAEGGERLGDGVYTVRATATASGTEGEANAPVTIDTTRPRLGRIRVSPDPISTHRWVRFTFRAEDRAPRLAVRLEVRDPTRRVGGRRVTVSPGTVTVRWRPRYAGGGLLYPGNYTARVTVRDDAANVARSRPGRWRVERGMRARVFSRLDRVGRRVALTFDDCHNPYAWSRILRVLRRSNVRAAFFCPGRQMYIYRRLVRRTVTQGHDVGSHGWDHDLLTRHSYRQVVEHLADDRRALWRLARRTTAPYFRPPFGAYDRTVLAAAGATSHPRVIMWDVDPQDWRSPGASVIASRVVRGARPGSIILLHTLPQTAAALPAIVTGLRRKDLRPVRLPQLFRAAGHR